MKISIERIGVAGLVAVSVALILRAAFSVLIHPAADPAAVALAVLLGWFVHRRLPVELDGTIRRHPVRSILFIALAVLSLVQTARLSSYMADPTRDWWLTTKQEFWSKHQCMTAYIYAADLNRQGEKNVYDAGLYPGLAPDAEVHTTVADLSPEDPYQYPPQFLLLPRLAIALSSDFGLIRAVWYALQALLFVAIAFWAARWYGGKSGHVAIWLIPLLWISVPSMLNFQYGQFHVTTIALAVAAYLAFDRGRNVLGGGLLAVSILAKGFPGIVLIPLLLQRRWRPVAWTAGWSLGLTGLALIVLGPTPFEAFFTYHLPRMASGAAFAFEDAWPELRTAILAGNVSPFAMVRKLGELGIVPASDSFARTVHGFFSVSLIGLAILASRFKGRESRALAWFALLNLAAMSSPAAWGDYVPVGSLWMLTLIGFDGSIARRVSLALAAGFFFLVPGIVPIQDFPGPNGALAISIVGTLLLIGVNTWVLARSVPVGVPLTETPRTVTA